MHAVVRPEKRLLEAQPGVWTVSVCDMQTDPKVFHLKCLLEGAVYKELGEEEMAIQVSGGFLRSSNLSWAVQVGLLTPLTFTRHR